MGEEAALVLVEPPRPRSPPRYPDMCGRRRMQLEVQILDREITFLKDELHLLEGAQPVSRSGCLKEVNEFVGTKQDPLIPMYGPLYSNIRFLLSMCSMFMTSFFSSKKRKHRSCRLYWWIRSKLCVCASWFCCCCQCLPKCKRPRCFNCSCCEPSCSCCSPNCSCFKIPSCCKPDCGCSNISSCFKSQCSSCCSLPCCSCKPCCSSGCNPCGECKPGCICCDCKPSCSFCDEQCCSCPRCTGCFKLLKCSSVGCFKCQMSCCKGQPSCFKCQSSCCDKGGCCSGESCFSCPKPSCPECSCGCVWSCKNCTEGCRCARCCNPCCAGGCLC